MTNKLQAPARVAAQFDTWCVPKRGRANPEVQTNDVWCWLIETEASAYSAHEALGQGEQKCPGWCFSRFGQSETRLSYGTVIYIGGEHEDYYDPDFYIYNDVIVVRPNGSIEIYGYPTDVFPPTDFHTATLIGDEIIVIGGLRYPEDRATDDTSIYRLKLSDFSIRQMDMSGDAPAWLYDHKAELDADTQTIRVSGGQVTHGPTNRLVENLTTWEVDLASNCWRAISTHQVQRWLLIREDEGCNDLWRIEQAAREIRSLCSEKDDVQGYLYFAKSGHGVDAELFFSRFSPPFPHTPIEQDTDDDDHRNHRISVDGVTIRFVEDMFEISVTIEGHLDPDRRAALERHGLETYSALEGVPYKIVHL